MLHANLSPETDIIFGTRFNLFSKTTAPQQVII